MNKPLQEYLTLSEASKILGMTEECVRRLCTNGKIKGAIKFGRTWAIPRSSIKTIHIPIPKPAPHPTEQDIRELNRIINEVIAQTKNTLKKE